MIHGSCSGDKPWWNIFTRGWSCEADATRIVLYTAGLLSFKTEAFPIICMHQLLLFDIAALILSCNSVCRCTPSVSIFGLWARYDVGPESEGAAQGHLTSGGGGIQVPTLWARCGNWLASAQLFLLPQGILHVVQLPHSPLGYQRSPLGGSWSQGQSALRIWNGSVFPPQVMFIWACFPGIKHKLPLVFLACHSSFDLLGSGAYYGYANTAYQIFGLFG